MSRLFTITANLLAETTCVYDGVSSGGTHRATKESFQVGGKGINVSRMAARLGWSTTAICFPGGDSGGACLRWLSGQPFAVAAFPQQEETRSGWVARCGGGETTFLGRDREIELGPWRESMEHLAREVAEGDVIALCGSVPGWNRAVASAFRQLLRRIGKKVFVAVDTYGAALETLIEERVDLIKINRAELAGVMKRYRAKSAEHFLEEKGVGRVWRWVITDGEKPVLARDPDGLCGTLQPARVKPVSAVGSGDVMLAGLLWGLRVRGLPFCAAVELGMAMGAANAAHPGVAEFPLASEWSAP